MLQVRDAFWRGVCPEGHEGAQQLRVGACRRNVEFCGSCRHAGHLRVDGRIGEDKAAPAQEHSVEAFYQSAVQGDVRGQNPDVLDAEVYGAVLTAADGSANSISRTRLS